MVITAGVTFELKSGILILVIIVINENHEDFFLI